MSKGKRGIDTERKLNWKKVGLVVCAFVLIIAAILIVINREKIFKNINKPNNEQISENDANNENKQKTIEEILDEFGGEITEQPKADTYFVKKDEKMYTIYSDGEIVEGQINIWNGESKESPADEVGNYNIYSAEELKWFADKIINGEKNFAGTTITLRANIDLGGRQKEDGTWEGPMWTSIVGFLDELQKDDKNTTKTEKTEEKEDSAKENLKRFAGCFDGNGFSIRGLYVESDKKYQGLFGYSSGIIQNLTLKNSYISGESVVGGIVGLNGGAVLNCKVQNLSIKGNNKIGGIAGVSMSSSTIKQCTTNSSVISAKDYVGGIVGYVNNNSTITESYNKSQVIGENYIGGVAGIVFYGTIMQSNGNESKVEGKDYVGGISGYSQALVEKNYNRGEIVGQNHISGLIGVNYTMGDITKSYNTGNVTGETNVGGISGTNNASISNCYNTGKIKTNNYRAGGICGQNGTESFIYLTYNIGKIEGNKNIDGISGDNFGTITTSYFLDSSIEDSNSDGEKSEEEMKTNLIVDLGEEFISDTDNKNNGYPILNWQ